MTCLETADAAVSLICLREGDGGPGLLVLPDLGGSIFYSRRLVANLDPSLAVWGAVLNVSAIPSDAAPSIPSQVTMILDAVEAGIQQPLKAVLGHSYSGFSAYEFACQSAARQRPLSRLFVLDTTVPWKHRHSRFRSLPVLGLEFARAVRNTAKNWRNYLPGHGNDELNAFGHGTIRLAAITSQLHPAVRHCYAAMTSYHPGSAPEATTMTLFVAVGHRRFAEFDLAKGWDTLAGGRIEIHRIVASHVDLVRSDSSLVSIAEIINDTLTNSNN